MPAPKAGALPKGKGKVLVLLGFIFYNC